MTKQGLLGAFGSLAFLDGLSDQHLMRLGSAAKPFAAGPTEVLARKGHGVNAGDRRATREALRRGPGAERVDEFLHISGRLRSIALQSAVGGMVLSLIGMIVAAAGDVV
jgi:hypothetical protein